MKTKRTIFTYECLRRLRNAFRCFGPDIANQDSGYSTQFRAEIIKRAKNAFNIQIENDKAGVRPLFKDRARIIKDQKEKNSGLDDSCNKPHQLNPGVQRYKTILFVPSTPGGA